LELEVLRDKMAVNKEEVRRLITQQDEYEINLMKISANVRDLVNYLRQKENQPNPTLEAIQAAGVIHLPPETI
jgi:hypothetical protein